MRQLTFIQKFRIIEHLTQKEGPVYTVATATISSLSSEYDRHIQNVAWTLDRFDQAFCDITRDMSETLLESVMKDLPSDLDRFAEPAGQRDPIQILSVRVEPSRFGEKPLA